MVEDSKYVLTLTILLTFEKNNPRWSPEKYTLHLIKSYYSI